MKSIAAFKSKVKDFDQSQGIANARYYSVNLNGKTNYRRYRRLCNWCLRNLKEA